MLRSGRAGEWRVAERRKIGNGDSRRIGITTTVGPLENDGEVVKIVRGTSYYTVQLYCIIYTRDLYETLDCPELTLEVKTYI